MPPPEHYDDFDPEAYDAETERLEALVHQRWRDDLRNLESEADARRKAAKRKRRDATSMYRAWREAFEAADPRPPTAADPAVVAEWEWRWHEYLYRHQGNDVYLNRHHLERGAFIARYTEIHRSAQASTEALLGPLREKAREEAGKPFVPEPWPVGDGISEWRQRLDEVMDPDEVEEEMAAREEPSYALANDLHCALLGWYGSLPEAARPFARTFHGLAGKVVTEVKGAHEPDYSPGNIGSHLLRMWEGLSYAQDAQDALDGLQGYDWLTRPAHACLKRIIEETRDAGLERYRALQAIYDGYLGRALRILGGTKWTPPPEAGEDA